MHRCALLLCLIALLAPAPAALAQNDPFGPLPPAAPEPTPTPTPEDDTTSLFGQDVGRVTLYAIAGGLIVLLVGIGYFISRDARRALPSEHRENVDRRRADPKERHRHEREKARARQKTRAQRAARKRNRK